MNDRELKVYEFHEAMGLAINEWPTPDLLNLRAKLIIEEAKEVAEALNNLNSSVQSKDFAHLIKELADLQYVLSGTIISIFGLEYNFDEAYTRVHESNMSKLDDEGKPIYNEYGKVIKGPNYLPPELEDLFK